ncbi:MFS transporter [Chloroflexia bacterium SDU3-3]|nr:MFS transporter [Chloroflexia bacterium SDU3-3]
MINPRLLAPKAFYFFWFASIGALTPFTGLYYRTIGFDLAQIGLIAAVSGVVQLFAGPLWAMLADAFRLRRALLPITLVLSIPPVVLLAYAQGFALLLLLSLLVALFSAPIVALADSATMALLGADRDAYGAQRLWGAVGWSVNTSLFGWLVERYGYWVIFPGYAAFALATAVVALALPRAELVPVNMRGALRSLARDGRWRRFLGCVFLVGCCSSVIISFLPLYLSDRGATGGQIGMSLTIASVSELVVMAVSPMVLRRWGARPLLVVGGLLYALRMLIYIAAPSPEWVLTAQVLHGISFGGFWIACVVEAQRLAPKGFEATAQSLLGMAMGGVASALASAAGGAIYRDYGSSTLFAIVGVMALAGAVGMLGGERHHVREDSAAA